MFLPIISCTKLPDKAYNTKYCCALPHKKNFHQSKNIWQAKTYTRKTNNMTQRQFYNNALYVNYLQISSILSL